MSEHSILPPSSAGIWGTPDGCTGWVLMAQMYPEAEDDEEALEGEASHEIGAALITDAKVGTTVRSENQFVGRTASNGVVYTKEMYDGAKIYADDVSNVMRTTGVFGGEYMGIEKKILAKSIHDLSFGTTDAFVFARHIGHLYIWDYKFGFEVVDPFENWQMINYLQGIVDEFGIDGIEDQNITVHIRIAQPRSFHRDGPIREWTIKLYDLRSYFNTLKANAHIALGNNSMLRTGSHCKYCQARHACTPFLAATLGLFEASSKPVPVDLSPEALGVQLAIVNTAFERVKSLKTAYMEQVKGILKKGGRIPNFMIEMGYGNLAWNKPVPEIIALGNAMNKKLQKPDDVITPTQAKALDIDSGLINMYTHKPKTGMKVVSDDGSKARKLFGAKIL